MKMIPILLLLVSCLFGQDKILQGSKPTIEYNANCYGTPCHITKCIDDSCIYVRDVTKDELEDAEKHLNDLVTYPEKKNMAVISNEKLIVEITYTDGRTVKIETTWSNLETDNRGNAISVSSFVYPLKSKVYNLKANNVENFYIEYHEGK